MIAASGFYEFQFGSVGIKVDFSELFTEFEPGEVGSSSACALGSGVFSRMAFYLNQFTESGLDEQMAVPAPNPPLMKARTQSPPLWGASQ